MRLARDLAEQIVGARIPTNARASLFLCLTDFLACVFTAHDLAPSRAARIMAHQEGPGAATVIGSTRRAGFGAAAFANAVAGHGLVREDMHAAAVSHLGVVVLPALFALAQQHRVSGAAFIDAAIMGYETGARLGRALVNPEFSRQWRPTGFTGPIAAAAGGARMLRLPAEATASALSLAANTAGGLNEWPHDGGEEMFFHPGFAARNGLTALALAANGAYGSAGALDGAAGLFAAARATPQSDLALFDAGLAEIDAVFRKALPVCNFAQTPAQAALRIRAGHAFDPGEVVSITVRASEAAVRYPGCDGAGPFARVLQAKMSIKFCIAAALMGGPLDESRFALPASPELLRLAALTHLDVDAGYTQAFPAKQGAAVAIELRDGRRHEAALDDLEPAGPDMVRARFEAAAGSVLGVQRASALGQALSVLASAEDAGALLRLAEPEAQRAASAA